MFFPDLIVVLIITSALVAVFALIFHFRGPWTDLMWFFIIVMLTTWAGGSWLKPLGPSFMGVHWLPYLFVGALISLLLTAATAQPPRMSTRRRSAGAWASATTLASIFWVLVVVLSAVLVFD